MINAKRSFRKILREWGHDVFIQRILPNGEYSTNFERVTTRQVGQSGVSSSLSSQETSEGLDIKYDAVYYFEDIVNPKEGDRIYENYSVKKNKEFTVFTIDTAVPIRGRLGEINFWTVGTTRER